jgi:hypothetical protein
VEYSGGGLLSQSISVTLNNPQQFNIKVVIKSAVVNGIPAFNVTVESWTKNQAILKIENAQSAERYDITLRVTSKDGVSRGERTFDIQLPLIVFHTPLKVMIPSILSEAVTDLSIPKANWSMQDASQHAGITKVVIEFEYFDGAATSKTEREYTCENGEPAGVTFTSMGGDTALACSALFPSELFTGSPSSQLAAYTFKVTVYDQFGLFAKVQSLGFDSGCGAYEAKLNDTPYPTLAEAVNAAAPEPGSPAEITVLRDISMDSSGPIEVEKGIRLVSQPGVPARVIKRASGNLMRLISVINSGELTLENIMIDGGAVWTGGVNAGISADEPLVFVYGSTLTLESGAKIQNNENLLEGSIGGGVCVMGESSLTMKGNAAVSGNKAQIGGGVFVNTGTFTMQGSAKISGNTALQGGGVFDNTEYNTKQVRAG